MCILVTNIQRFSLHDGPGIRTTVFLKGCALRCPWCSNPECLEPHQEIYTKDGVIGTYGTFYSSEELVRECLKDRAFYEGEVPSSAWSIHNAEEIDLLPGGVTFSGGEALLQMKSLSTVCKMLHANSIHVAVETSLFVPADLLDQAFDHIDFFYVDVKILDAKRCLLVERGNIDLFLSNLDSLMQWKDEQGRGRPVVIRVPVIGNQTDTRDNRHAVKELLSKYRGRILKIELIKEHRLGMNKYASLGIDPVYHGVDDSLMEVYRDELSELGIRVEICKL